MLCILSLCYYFLIFVLFFSFSLTKCIWRRNMTKRAVEISLMRLSAYNWCVYTYRQKVIKVKKEREIGIIWCDKKKSLTIDQKFFMSFAKCKVYDYVERTKKIINTACETGKLFGKTLCKFRARVMYDRR